MMLNFTSSLPIRSKPLPRDLQHGFSLLELLVSLAILALLVTLLYGSFSQISRTTLSVEQSLRAREELRLLMKVVLDDLQAVQYLPRLVALNDSQTPGSLTTSFETGLIVRLAEGPEGPESSSELHFHAARKARFFPEWRAQDPQLHEIGYRLLLNQETQRWGFWRREDFYVDETLTEGGRDYLLTDRVVLFRVELLEQEIQLADGGTQENWVQEWDSTEGACERNGEENNSFCLPRALRLTLAVEAEDGQTLQETLAINLCVRPCKPEWFE